MLDVAPADTHIQLSSGSYEPRELPVIFFGREKPLAYVHNAKAACTLALNFLFFADHGYAYFDPAQIHGSRFALNRLGPEFAADRVRAFNDLAPETFSFVRDPLDRFVSGFISKIFSRDDAQYIELRDLLTSVHGVDLSADADPARSCLAFATVIAAQRDAKAIDRHFRPQYLNLGLDGGFRVDTILRLEDGGAVPAFFANWIGLDRAQCLAAQKLGATPGYPKDRFMSAELTELVRAIYARDYELFYG